MCTFLKTDSKSAWESMLGRWNILLGQKAKFQGWSLSFRDADLLDRGVGGVIVDWGGGLILLFSVVWGEEVKGGGLLLYGGGVIVDVGEEWGGGVIVVMGGCFSFGGTVQYIEESNIYLCFVVCRLKRGLVTWPNLRVIKRRISYPYQLVEH